MAIFPLHIEVMYDLWYIIDWFVDIMLMQISAYIVNNFYLMKKLDY